MFHFIYIIFNTFYYNFSVYFNCILLCVSFDVITSEWNFLRWVYRIIYQGSKKDIEENDIPQPVHEDKSAEAGDKLERLYF